VTPTQTLRRDDLLAVGTWKPAWIGPPGDEPFGQWRQTALVCDPSGHVLSLSQHQIDDAGKVTPSLLCPNGCGWHEWLLLDGWDPRARPNRGRADPAPPAVLLDIAKRRALTGDIVAKGFLELRDALAFIADIAGHRDVLLLQRGVGGPPEALARLVDEIAGYAREPADAARRYRVLAADRPKVEEAKEPSV